MSGQVAADGTFDGRITARGPDLSRLVPAPAPCRFRRKAVSPQGEGLAAAKDMRLELGGANPRAGP